MASNEPRAANDVVTLVVEGDPDLDEFVRAAEAFQRLLRGLGDAVAPHVRVDWALDDLVRSSAHLSAKGSSERPEVVEQIAVQYIGAGKAAQQPQSSEFLALTRPVRNAAESLRNLIGVRIPQIRLETIVDDAIITTPTVATQQLAASPILASWGSVSGRVETLSRHSSLRFVLYDLRQRGAVTCYMEPGQEDAMRELWGHLATVEGFVKRDPVTGRAINVRHVRHVEPLQELAPDAWMGAIGALPRRTNEPPEHTIRRLRDAN